MTSLLMIEDDERLAGMVADYLSASGYEVAHAADAQSGLARLQGAAHTDRKSTRLNSSHT